MNKYIEKIIPQKFHEGALNTVPGRLASLLDEVIYNLSECKDESNKENNYLENWLMIPRDTTDRLSLGDFEKKNKLPADMQWMLSEDRSYEVNTKKLLREICHYLEAQALKEVL